MFKIVGYYEGAGEVVDESDDKGEAETLAAEYRIAYGPGWSIEVVQG